MRSSPRTRWPRALTAVEKKSSVTIPINRVVFFANISIHRSRFARQPLARSACHDVKLLGPQSDASFYVSMKSILLRKFAAVHETKWQQFASCLALAAFAAFRQNTA